MKRGHYVEGLTGSKQLMAAIVSAENRGAPEASWVLAEGDFGYGKSATLLRIAVQKNAVFVRSKGEWRPRWCLTDIADGLSIPRMHRTQDLLSAIITELMQRPRMLVIDEIKHAARNEGVLETLRDITDTTECVLVAGGVKGVRGLIKRFPETYSRIAEIVTFGPASFDDVKLMCVQLTDVEIADDLVKAMQQETGGRLRLVMNAIARVEAFGKKSRGKVTLDMWGSRPLVLDGERSPNG